MKSETKTNIDHRRLHVKVRWTDDELNVNNTERKEKKQIEPFQHRVRVEERTYSRRSFIDSYSREEIP